MWMWFPIGIFQSPNFSLRESSKKKFDTASSRGLPQQPYQRFDSEIWLRSDDVQGRKGRRRYRQMSAICCLQRCLMRRQLLKLQSRTADEKNPWRKRRIWRGRSTTCPSQSSTKTGAILFGVANWVHIHLKPTSMCGINVVGGGGGGGVCVCVSQWKKVPDEWQARQATPAILQVSSSKHNAKKITTRVRGPFHQSITAILTEEKKRREAVTKPTHVAVYLFRDLDRDRSRV